MKKKKRAPKVGYARDEGDEEDPANPSAPSIPSVDSADHAQSEPPISTPAADNHPPRLEEVAPSQSHPTQVEKVGSQPESKSNPGDVPSYILRKEEIMRKANGASAPPPAVAPEPQRRDSRTVSDTPKMTSATTAQAPVSEPSDKASDR